MDIEARSKRGEEQACVWEEMRRSMSTLLRETAFAKFEVDFSR
jgi:hypothetical protein